MPIRTDEHGEAILDPTLPPDVQTSDASLERWQTCIGIATLITQAPAGSPEAHNFARVLYDSQHPLHRADAPPPGENDLLEARWEEWEHPRGRHRQFIDKPDVPKRVQPKSIKRRFDDAKPKITLEQIKAAGLDKDPEPSEKALKLLDGHTTTAARYYEMSRATSAEDSDEHPPYQAKRRRRHDLVVGRFLAGLPQKPGQKPRGIAALLGTTHPVVQKLHGGARLSEREKRQVREAAHNARSGEAPSALFMAGGPASGKTTLLRDNPELVPDASVAVDPDAIKEHLPEFKQLQAEKDRYAAGAVHEESGDIAARLTAEAASLRLNMVVDGTGDGEAQRYVGHLQRKYDEGYDVSVLYANSPTEEAIRRAIIRAEEEGRFVPVSVIREQHARVSKNFPDVVTLPWLENLDVFDEHGHIGSKEGGKFHPLDYDRMKTFLEKEKELGNG